MVHFFVGTGAELIKVMPIMSEMRRRRLRYRYVDSGQHARTTKWLRDDFDIPTPDLFLDHRETNVRSLAKGLWWLGRHTLSGKLHPRRTREEVFAGGGIVLVYADTASALLGLELARAAKLPVGHLEAGLRSFRTFSPFPEELIRVRCMKKSEVLFPPNPTAAGNLRDRKLRGRIIEIDGNTIVDALRMALAKTPTVNMPDGPFALAAIHRMETITKPKRFRRIIGLIRRAAERITVRFILYPATETYLRKFDLMGELESGGVEVVPMLPHYYDFIAMAKAARFIMADGCGVQEECGYLNKPYLILRNETERDDGLGRNAVLWKGDDAIAERFLDTYEQLGAGGERDWPEPSAQIVDALVELGYAVS